MRVTPTPMSHTPPHPQQRTTLTPKQCKAAQRLPQHSTGQLNNLQQHVSLDQICDRFGVRAECTHVEIDVRGDNVLPVLGQGKRRGA